MFELLQSILLYLLIPAGAVIAGGIVAAVRPPSATVRNYIQHFAAGLVFAAVAGELLPEVTAEHSAIAVIIGFALGVAAMLVVKHFTAKVEADGEKEASPGSNPPRTERGVTSLLVTIAFDIAVDGLLIGLGFVAGGETGILLMLALSTEVLFLGLSVAVALNRVGATPLRVIGATVGLAALLVVGAVIGVLALGGLSGPPLATVLAFGAAALLYLVTEELLVEAHEVKDTPVGVASFFLGFLALLVVETVV